jgi:O-antigen/teichoic acid export membrane protein
MPAASFIYQCVIVTTLLTMLKVPFVAVIMGAEEMKFFSIVEILYNVIKLANVLLLLRYTGDRLVAYGILNILAILIVLILYYVVCRLKFSFCRIYFKIERGLGKKILAFSGFDLFSSVSVIARSQGVNMLLNMFFGVVMNAAGGVAMQVQGVVLYFGRNLFDAARPRIIKNYSNGEYEKMCSLINKSSQLTTMVLLLLSVPLMVEIDYVLKLWLSVVPNYASIFCRYVLLFNIMAAAFFPVTVGIHATGRIKWMSIITGVLYILVIPFSYIGYKVGLKPEIAYGYNLFAAFIAMFINAVLLEKYVVFLSKKVFLIGAFKCFSIGLFDYVIVMFCNQQMTASIVRLFCSVIFSSLILTASTYFFVLDRKDRSFVLEKIKLISAKV